MGPFITVQDVRVPSLLYGTAWKEERTRELTELALRSGFRAIDTANQRKHYVEAAVGEAVRASQIPRAELFLQTKFTYVRGQDHRLPYDPMAPIATQVEQSFERSLEQLGVSYIDSFVLHGPWLNTGLAPQDREAWQVMQELKRSERVRFIGISNVSASQLTLLCKQAEIKPAFVQNRCYARSGWDREVRKLCRSEGAVYQGFSLLTANQRELAGDKVQAMAQRLGATVPQLVFAFATALGMLPLTGTSDPTHMAEDLKSLELTLSASDVALLERIGER
jgi:diketogulonate reductase-like aldo/keto reductase